MARPFIPAPNCASVELIYTQNAITAENIFNVRKASPFTSADLVTLRNVIDAWDNNNWKNGRATNVFLQRIRIRALDTNASPIEDYLLPVPRGGTSGGAAVPSNVTYCIKMSTGFTGRSQRGRIYIFGLTQGCVDVNNSTFLASCRSSYIGFLNALMATLNTNGFTLVVLSYMSNGNWRAVAQATPVTSFIGVDLNVDSMRRRLPGRGRS